MGNEGEARSPSHLFPHTAGKPLKNEFIANKIPDIIGDGESDIAAEVFRIIEGLQQRVERGEVSPLKVLSAEEVIEKLENLGRTVRDLPPIYLKTPDETTSNTYLYALAEGLGTENLSSTELEEDRMSAPYRHELIRLGMACVSYREQGRELVIPNPNAKSPDSPEYVPAELDVSALQYWHS